MKCSLDKLPSILGLPGVQKGFYAWRLADHDRALNYRGKLPAEHYFGVEKLCNEKQEEFWTWYRALEADPNFIYDMKAEALKYCK